MGIYGLVNYVPEISKQCINVESDVNFIDGTSEIRLGYEHSKLNAVAYEYASYYNRLMRYYRENELGFKCDL